MIKVILALIEHEGARGKIDLRKPGRGTHQQPVFGIYEHGGRVYTELIPDCSATALSSIIKGKAKVSSVIYTDAWRGYDNLLSVGYDKHVRIKKQSEGFAQKQRHINVISPFGVSPNDGWPNLMA